MGVCISIALLEKAKRHNGGVLPPLEYDRAPKGRYSVRRLIEKYGRRANLMKWKEQLNGDRPKRDAHSMLERCDLLSRFAEGPIKGA